MLINCNKKKKHKGKGLAIWLANHHTSTENKQKSDGEEKFAHKVYSTNLFPHYLVSLHKVKKEEEGWLGKCPWSCQMSAEILKLANTSLCKG